MALLLALVSRGNVRQAKVPMFEVPNLSRGIVHNVCVYGGLGFRSASLSQVTERNYKTKLDTNTKPQAVINTLLCTVALLHLSIEDFLVYVLLRVERDYSSLVDTRRSGLPLRYGILVGKTQFQLILGGFVRFHCRP